jgi:UDP-3-O-acyl-N-acetylglucosamine deacetylase
MSTIKQQIKVQGKGLMDGKDSIVEIFPSEKKGIRFFKNKTELSDSENVVSTQNCTVIAKDGSVFV